MFEKYSTAADNITLQFGFARQTQSRYRQDETTWFYTGGSNFSWDFVYSIWFESN